MLALTKLRLERGMSTKDLADLSGVDDDTIYYLESGRTQSPRPHIAKKIVDALGVGMWDVYQCEYDDRRLRCKEVEC